MKNKITAIVLIITVLFFSVAHFVCPDRDFSESERRKLASLPEISADSLMSGKYLQNFEKYMLDQFPGRDTAVALKAVTQYNLFGQRDNNGFYLIDGGIYKSNYPMKQDSIVLFANKLNKLYNDYLKDCNVICTVVPDRGQYVAKENGYLYFDFDGMEQLLKANLTEQIKYVPINNLLDNDSFYNTDLHWKQEALLPTAEFLASQFGVTLPEIDYTPNKFNDFKGGYYSRAPYYLEPETLVYLTSKYTESSFVTDLDDPNFHKVYNPDSLGKTDSYDVYLSGATPLTVIDNPLCDSGKELIIFRDSFGSSLAPLLLSSYSKITLIDIRYIASDLLANYVDFNNQDVLFLYGTEVINSSIMLK